MRFEQLNARQTDALKEISNIGMGHAATALSQLLGETMMLKVPRVTVTEFAAVPELIGGAEKPVVGIILRILGDACGSLLLIFPCDSASRLLSGLLGPGSGEGEFSEMDISTLKEVGNIVASAYLSALGQMLNLSLIPSVPAMACDMAGAVIDQVLVELGGATDMALMLETQFHGGGQNQNAVTGHCFVLPDPDSLRAIFQAMEELS
jgi:chemotaxis protein CheC